MQLIQNYWLAAEIEDSTVSRFIAVYSGIGFILVLFLLQRAFSVVGLGFGASLSNSSTLLSSIIRALMYFYDATTPLWKILGQVRVSKAIVAMRHKNSQTYLLVFTDAQNVLNCHQGMNIFLNLAPKSDVSPSLISIFP